MAATSDSLFLYTQLVPITIKLYEYDELYESFVKLPNFVSGLLKVVGSKL